MNQLLELFKKHDGKLKNIADEMGVSTHTVLYHVRNNKDVFGYKTRYGKTKIMNNLKKLSCILKTDKDISEFDNILKVVT